jgi:hypothetical protein
MPITTQTRCVVGCTVLSTFARGNRLTTHFSGRNPVVKRRISVHSAVLKLSMSGFSLPSVCYNHLHQICGNQTPVCLMSTDEGLIVFRVMLATFRSVIITYSSSCLQFLHMNAPERNCAVQNNVLFIVSLSTGALLRGTYANCRKSEHNSIPLIRTLFIRIGWALRENIFVL